MSNDLHLLSSYQYHLPEELIATHPCTPRDSSRLMVVDRATGNLNEMQFRELADFLTAGDSLVFNNTKVIPARLYGTLKHGGAAEIFLIKNTELDHWQVMAKPGKKMKPRDQVFFSERFSAEILETLPDGTKLVKFHYDGDFSQILEKYGQIPLPHYMKREPDEAIDNKRYQTVYAKKSGAVAAPTAGLHFTDELIEKFKSKNIDQHYITLHVGLGTFKPVQVDDIRDHQMHKERVEISTETAMLLNSRSRKKRQICVGTTCCRSLESSYINDKINAGAHETDIFIYPGYQFKYVNHLLTNFHLPGSSLLMLVSAFAGYELIKEAYKKAIIDKYRFFSYGDAMLIL